MFVLEIIARFPFYSVYISTDEIFCYNFSVTALYGFESIEESNNKANDADDIREYKMSRRSANDNTGDEITFPIRSIISWGNLVTSLNLTAQDVDLR